jgi:uncharacterized protein (TIGR00297 family)
MDPATAPHFLEIAQRHRLWSGALAGTLFAVLARGLRGVTTAGAAAGAVISFVLFWGAGWGALAALVTVFSLTSLATRIGYRRKQFLGTAEKREGRRSSQVVANLAVATICAGGRLLIPSSVLLVAAAAALAEAAADTVSSELGQASRSTPRLITTWERVATGTDGAITMAGTLAGLLAAAIVSLISAATGFLPARWIFVSICAAVAGMFADSLLGASFERRHRLNNDSVNFLGTLIAAAMAALAAWVLSRSQ